jgi:hypothetical protein
MTSSAICLRACDKECFFLVPRAGKADDPEGIKN